MGEPVLGRETRRYHLANFDVDVDVIAGLPNVYAYGPVGIEDEALWADLAQLPGLPARLVLKREFDDQNAGRLEKGLYRFW